ncbi:MAG: hypothetical protein FWF24_07475, partial [Alphaproteobacteria bacterium]|nr:hypothetical protein [Alphaproteobacteria bacterium]
MVPSHLFTIAFRTQRLGLLFGAIMVIMVYIGSLAMAAQAVLARTASSWNVGLDSRVTIEVEAALDDTLSLRHERIKRIEDALRARADVIELNVITQEKTARLIEPWIKDPALMASLPLPILIDVVLKEKNHLDEDALAFELGEKTGTHVRVHRQTLWADDIKGFVKGLGHLSWMMIVLTALALVLTIVIVCRASMALQRDTIELLHFMGATDLAITQAFQRRMASFAVWAAGIGFFLAAMTLALLIYWLAHLGGLSLIANASWVIVSVVMILVPVCAVFLT